METLYALMMLAAVVIGIWMFIKLLAKPIKFIFKFALHALLGYVLLFLISFFGEFVGIHIELSLLNVLITGFFGLPGVVFLVLLSFLL